MELKEYKLGDIAEIVNGSTPTTTCPHYYDGDIVWITPKDLSEQKSKYIEKGERNITEAGFNSCSTHLIPKYNILLTSRAPIGLLAINKVACCTNQGFKNLIVNKDIVDVDYLYYYLKYHIAEIEALGTGTTFKEVSKASMEKYTVSLPDLEEQKKVSRILSALDAKISLNRQINQNLEALARQIYDYWFVQFDFPDANGKPYKSSGGRMLYNLILKREIPEGWEVKAIKEIESNIITGKTPSTSEEDNFGGNIPFVTIDDIRKYMYIYESERTLSEKGADSQSSKYLPKGSLSCSCIGTAGILGFIGTLAQTNQQINSIIFNKDYNRELIYFALKWHFSHATAKMGNILPNMSKDEFSRIPIVYPQIDILMKYHNLVKDLFCKIDNGVCTILSLTKQRDELLPLLMNGQVNFDLSDD